MGTSPAAIVRPLPRRSLAVRVAAAAATLCLGLRAQEAATPTLTLPAFTGFAHPDPEGVHRRNNGTVEHCDGQLVFYVDFATTGELHLALERMAGPAGELRTTVISLLVPDGKGPTTTTGLSACKSDETAELGMVTVTQPGYHRIVLERTDGSSLRNLRALRLSGPATAGAHATLVERRNAASVHLGYPVDKAHEDDIEWFYCEVTPRTDPLWTYYMATGWHRGYFGMQVNSPTERRLIFSVWDAGNEGVDRKKVAADDQVQLIAKGKDVVADSFGNEGTGGHSHLVYDWKLGETFRFLMHAKPDGDHTTYTGWFWFAEQKQWGLIASFRAPKDGKRLHGLYSFNENFSGSNGDLQRDCEFGNVWTRTSGGEWLPMRTARFTHDGTGKSDRMDRCGGVRGDAFYLQNGGFVKPPKDAALRSGTPIAATGKQGEHPVDSELPAPPQRGESPR
jgi:hypothetical protein